MGKSKSSNLLIFTVVGMLLFALLALLVVNQADKSRSDIAIYGAVPGFEFVDQNGEPFGLENMIGKLSIVDFIFTRCHGPCPTMAIYMSELYELYRHSDKVQFVSISVEPSYDSLAVLKRYADEHGVNDNRWRFLRADSVKLVADLCENGFMLAADELPGSHTTKFIVVDQNGMIRSYHDGTDDVHIERLKAIVKILADTME